MGFSDDGLRFISLLWGGKKTGVTSSVLLAIVKTQFTQKMIANESKLYRNGFLSTI